MNASNTTFSGSLAGGMNLVKQGNGAFTLLSATATGITYALTANPGTASVFAGSTAQLLPTQVTNEVTAPNIVASSCVLRVDRRLLPGETQETIEETIKFATEINPHTLQVSLAAPYPGTFLYNQAVENNWLDAAHAELIDENGVQMAPLHYPHLSHSEIFQAVETFYRRFYFRPRKIAELTGEMMRSWQLTKRRLREGVEFFRFLHAREA